MEIGIRRMRADDLDSIMAIESVSFPKPWSRRQFENELANPVSIQLVVFVRHDHEEKTVGYMVFWLIHGEAHILNIAVDPRMRKRGLGRGLLVEALGIMRKKGVYEAFLEVRRSNEAAISLYRSFGFTALFERKNYYGDEDAIVMRLLF